jgi:hypothetical protein
MYHVYHLVDPRDSTVRYIGKTTNPKGRLRAHIQEASERQNTDKKRWIHELCAARLKPVLIIFASLQDEPTARKIESQQCAAHLSTITNVHDPAKGAKSFKKLGEAK